MKTRKLKLKRVVTVILSVLLMASIVHLPVVAIESTVQAEEGVTTENGMISLGTNGIADPVTPTSENDVWQGSYVYFGTHDGNAVKYRVLDSNSTDFGGNTMLLDCDSVLWDDTNSDGQSNAFDAESNIWADSDIRAYLNGTFLSNCFSVQEQQAIAASFKREPSSTDGDGWSRLNYVSLDGDKIFLLDAKEITNTSYGYYNIDEDVAGRMKRIEGYPAAWWLRSSSISNKHREGYIGEGGIIGHSEVNCYANVSPACNINLSSVLFLSAIEADKTSALTSAGSRIGTTTGTEWKLTVSDEGKKIQIADNERVIQASDGTITVPYAYTDTADTEEEKVNQISVVITDKAYTESDAQVLYYGALKDIAIEETSGTGTFELPSDLDGKELGEDYRVYILAEHVNTTNATDYASTPEEITDICEEAASVTVNVNWPVGGQPLDTTPDVSSNISDVKITWIVKDGKEVMGNALYNTAHTAQITLTAAKGYAFTDRTKVILNEENITATNTNSGTITLEYTFPATERGIMEYTATEFNGTYDGQEHGINVKVTEPATAKISYSTDAGEDKTYSTNNPTFTDVGEYTVYYKIEDEDYMEVRGSQKVTITERNIVVTANEQCILQGNDISQEDYAITDEGLATGDTLTCSLAPSTGELTGNGTITVSNVRVINRSGKDVTKNYEIYCASGNLVIYVESRVVSDDITVNYRPFYDEGVQVSLWGNTFAKLTDGEDNSLSENDYSVRYMDNLGNGYQDVEITLRNTYLDTLDAGSYTYKVYVYLQGVETSKGPLACTFKVNVNKETPVIAEAPVATAITYGETLASSDLKGGKVQHNKGDSTTVEGSFTWKDADVKPTVADSMQKEYTVTFTPTDINNYNVVETSLTVTVNKAENAPNMPENIMKVPYDKDRVSAVILPDGWIWQEEAVNKELTVGTAVTAIAIYEGTDKGNYENEMVTVSITRSDCEHSNTEVRGAKAATCTEKGYTGDTYCKTCMRMIQSGTDIDALGHNFAKDFTVDTLATCKAVGSKSRHCSRCEEKTEITEIPKSDHTWDDGKITKEATEAGEGVKTYFCRVCGATKTEPIPKKDAVTTQPSKDTTMTQPSKEEATPQQPAEESTVSQPPKNGDVITDNKSNAKYEVIDTVKKEVTYNAPVDGKAKDITIPDTITINGEIYKVMKIADNAFKGNQTVTIITIGSNIQTIGKNAFKECKRLKTIIIKSKKLNVKKISKKAFKGISKKTVIKVPKKRLAACKKLLKKKGLSSKNRIKGY